MGQIPLYYADNLTQIPDATDTRYWDGSSAPLYPFGFGLSYSTFRLDNLHASSPVLHRQQELRVSVDVQNASGVGGDDVVQLYTHQRAGSAARPVRELKGFQRVHLEPNETQNVTLTLKTNDLSFWSPAKHRRVTEAGIFDVWIGDSSQATLHTTFTLESEVK